MASPRGQRSAKDIAGLVETGVLNKDEGISSLIAYLLDTDWRNDTRRAAAEGLSLLGNDFGAPVIAALGTTSTEGDVAAQEQLAKLPADPLVKWLVSALGSKPTHFVGQGTTVASFGFHWKHAVKVAGWLKRAELVQPLVQQLMVDETGREQVETVGKALACYGDLAVEALIPLLSNSKLVWTRPALEKEPLADRALIILEGRHAIADQSQSYELIRDFDTPKATKALKKAKGWWNMRRFSSNFRNTIKNRS
jgi:hypothetical protein